MHNNKARNNNKNGNLYTKFVGIQLSLDPVQLVLYELTTAQPTPGGLGVGG